MRPTLKDVTLVAVDTTAKAILGERAILKSMEQCEFGAVKLLTDNPKLQFSAPIPKITDMEGYSRFCIKELHKHIQTSHCLLVQHDGYVLNGNAWTPEFLKYDYIGAPWGGRNLVGNGGFSLRSRRLLKECANPRYNDSPHPEDDFICRRHRADLEAAGLVFSPKPLADRFAVEGASFIWSDYAWMSDGRRWKDQFGFHSFLTPIGGDRPLVFHHSGDLGDIIYSLPVIKALGGGVLFLSSDCRYPFPGPPRTKMTHTYSNTITPFLEEQDYIWKSKFTPEVPYSTDCDLNAFRMFYRSDASPKTKLKSLFHLHLDAFGLSYPEESPWLKANDVTRIPGRPIVVNRTPRYHNDHFPWLQLIKRYASQMVFVGGETEANHFKFVCEGLGVTVPWFKTETVSDLARVIAGAGVFIGNQSAPMAIALGLGQNIIQECWQGNPNCLFKRDNAIFWGVSTTSPEIEIPKEWLTKTSC